MDVTGRDDHTALQLCDEPDDHGEDELHLHVSGQFLDNEAAFRTIHRHGGPTPEYLKSILAIDDPILTTPPEILLPRNPLPSPHPIGQQESRDSNSPVQRSTPPPCPRPSFSTQQTQTSQELPMIELIELRRSNHQLNMVLAQKNMELEESFGENICLRKEKEKMVNYLVTRTNKMEEAYKKRLAEALESQKRKEKKMVEEHESQMKSLLALTRTQQINEKIEELLKQHPFNKPSKLINTVERKNLESIITGIQSQIFDIETSCGLVHSKAFPYSFQLTCSPNEPPLRTETPLDPSTIPVPGKKDSPVPKKKEASPPVKPPTSKKVIFALPPDFMADMDKEEAGATGSSELGKVTRRKNKKKKAQLQDSSSAMSHEEKIERLERVTVDRLVMLEMINSITGIRPLAHRRYLSESRKIAHNSLVPFSPVKTGVGRM